MDGKIKEMQNKILVQSAGILILTLLGLWFFILGDISWMASAISWSIAGIWAIAIVGYLVKNGNNVTADNETSNAQILEDIKTDIIKMDEYQREAAVIKAKGECPENITIQINKDLISIYGRFEESALTWVNHISSTRDTKSLVKYFQNIGNVMDSNDYGLKLALEYHEQYKSTQSDLDHRQIRLKYKRKKRAIVHNNINIACTLIYGLNSSIIFKRSIDAFPQRNKLKHRLINATLEDVENLAKNTLTAMLNDLESECKIITNGT